MFGLTHSKNAITNNAFDTGYSDSYIQRVTHIAPLMWGEHCVECGMPVCYKTCLLYVNRGDGSCKRFRNGIEKLDKISGLYSYAVKIECMKWGKIGAVLLPNCLSKSRILRQNRFFNFITDITKFFTKIIPAGFFKCMDYYFKEFVTRTEGSGSNLPDEFLIEISNPNKDYDLCIENMSEGDLLYRNKITVKNGFNQFHIPFPDFNYVKGKRNFLNIIPQNEEQTMYIHTLDMVKVSKKNTGMSDGKIKCVIWDLDNTLWKGILSEDTDVKLNKNIVRHIETLDNKGVLNSISSKNNYEETYNKLKTFGIEHYFLYPQINWQPKSENICIIAKLLNIGVDTFMFIDDSEFELAEVASQLPMVKCYNVSKVEEAMNCDALKIEISEESKNRRLSYREIEQRNQAEQSYSGNIDVFLRSCEMLLTITLPTETTFSRCLELINRTNQLNSSGERIQSDMLQKIIADKKQYLCLQMSCIDKFGDYGIIGFCIININNKERAICEHFVLSCRAARKKIEQSFFEFLIRYFREAAFDFFAIKCTTTPKNGQLLSVFSGLSFFTKHKINDKQFILEVATQKKIDFINIVGVEHLLSHSSS
jgi:FkbH-like protein